MRAFSIEKTIRKRPQNTLARRVARRKEERKERKSLLAVMVRRFFICGAKSCEKRLRAEYTETKSVYVYTETKNGSNYIYIIVGNKK